MLTRKMLLSSSKLASSKLASSKRAIVLALLAALVLTMAEPPLAAASQLSPATKGVSVTGSSDATDFSAAARRRRTVHRRGGGNAAGLAFMGMAIGTIAGIAAQQQRQDYYNNNYYNNGYGYAPGYYGGGPYYGRRYYGY